jgi:serine/threonine-protein kinase haspin
MRTYLHDGKRVHKREKHHMTPRQDRWANYTPYSNVLWVRYLLEYGIEKLKKELPRYSPDLYQLKGDLAEFNRKLNPKTAPDDGAFVDATEMLAYMVEKGWVTKEQIEGKADELDDADISLLNSLGQLNLCAEDNE